jgi:transposase
LFRGSLACAQRAAVLLSLIESCAQNDVNPFEYLRDVLQRVSTHPHSRIDELTPAGWKAARTADARVA